MSKRADSTAVELLRAAERLFAERGVDAVSLREIAAAAGQRNHSAALYHFGDKRTLVNALLERHSDPIQHGWAAVVEHMTMDGRDTLEELVGLMVRTLVRKLDDPDGGREYLLVVAQLTQSPGFPVNDLPATQAPGILALMGAMMRHLDAIPQELLLLRMFAVTSLLYGSIASYDRLTRAGMDLPRDLFVADLIVSISALLRAPRPGV